MNLGINTSHILITLIIILMSIFYKILNSANKSSTRIVDNIKNITMAESEHFVFNESPSKKPLPIFFFSHGGPDFADGLDNPGAWETTKKVGRYIQNKVKPDFIIVVSAHWQTNKPDEIEVALPGIGEAWYTQNSVTSKKIRSDENGLIYDYYGFPKRFYETQFHTVPNKFIANDIVKTLKESDWFQSKTQERGIDHGVFVPLKVAFGEPTIADSNKLDVEVPLIQVSLAGTSDIEIHYRLGEALNKYRDLNGAILFSGMSVHNLRDHHMARALGNKPLHYNKPFHEIINKLLLDTKHEDQLEALKQLPRNPEWNKIYKAAHPTNEHLLPAIVAAGASRGDECKLLYGDEAGSLGWNIYSWGSTDGLDI